MKHFSIIFVLVVLFVLASTSFAQVNWTKDTVNNPVLVPGPSGTWSDYSLLPICVFFDGSSYHMWYGGHDGTTARIGYATSADGIHNWTPYLGNPVLDVGPSGSWDDARVSSPYVLYDGSTYHMWYNGYDGTYYRIGYATSTDGTTWTKYAANPVMDKGPAGSWYDNDVTNPCVLHDGSTYHMWFAGYNGSDRICIGYATSNDGMTWTVYDSVLTPDPGEWDGARVEAPDVYFDGSVYHMWYSAANTLNWWYWKAGYAISSDGINWTKYADNPVLDRGPAGSWDQRWAAYGRVLYDADSSQYKMWYGGGSGDWNAKIGYATAPKIVGIKRLDVNLLNDYVLKQNYPNPFNPTTNIEFSIPKSEFVTLKVYNILGEEVATLVSERLAVGKYKYDWDASSFTSGVYLYRIQAGDYVDVKKMILLR